MITASQKRSEAVKTEIFREYCSSSSIHGVRYFDGVERTSCERFWWAIVFLLSMVGCGTMIYKAYIKWNQAPIIVTFSEKTTPVWDVQFPAVTICPETKVPTAKLNFTTEINSLKAEYLNHSTTFDAAITGQLKVVAQLCNDMFHDTHYYLSFFNGTDENDVVNALRNMSLNRHRAIGMCSFDNTFLPVCGPYMQEIVTEEGLCYSFNMMQEDEVFRTGALHSEHTYMADWYDYVANDKPRPKPLQARGAGVHAGLMLYLLTDKTDIDYLCSGFSQGYKLMLHESSEYPQVSKRHIRVPLGHEISIAVKPQMISTSQSAADYHWRKRQCFFNHERHLRFFAIYNQENCELECLANITLAVCGCVRFSMPRATGTEICPLHKWHCMYDARSVLRKNLDSFDVPLKGVRRIMSGCNCLPACSSIQYDVEVTQSAMDLKKFLEANQIVENEKDRFTISMLSIYFKESNFITSKRSELYGLVDFLANCGGLLGLFMGVSILSLLEICYYITIRPLSLRKTRRSSASKGKDTSSEVNNTLLAVVSKMD